MRRLFVIACMLSASLSMYAQNDTVPREELLRRGLDELAARDSVYNQRIDVSVTNFSIFELVKGIAISNGLSIDMNFDRRKTITCNISRIPIKDVLYFICSEKAIDADIVGNIVTLADCPPPPPPAPAVRPPREQPSVRRSMPKDSVFVYTMKYRTVDKIVDIIPTELKMGMEIKTFHDLNGLVISGKRSRCDSLVMFLDDIDRSVPLISIDVMIVDATCNSSQSLGLGIGIGESETQIKGKAGPGLDVTLNAESLGRILSSFTGLGSINLGPVTSLFYADLQLLEEAGKIVLRSTPRLSTLNGHKASLKSGEVQYYKENQVNIIGTQNPLQSESYLWKNVEANFVLEITPHVSRDSTITMDISLSQDEFTTEDTDDKYTPPGISKRSFTSIIKVKDGEMVLLGGIERNLKDNSSKGLPYAARVPGLRSIFGKTRKENTDSRLNIFIKPTIIF